MKDAASRLAAALAAMPYARALGVEGRLEDDRLLVALPFRADLVGNPILPALHGGLICGFLEIAALLDLDVIHRLKGARTIGVTAEYLRPAGPRTLLAHSGVRRLGRRVVNVEVEAWQDDPGRLVALLHGRFSLPGSASAD